LKCDNNLAIGWKSKKSKEKNSKMVILAIYPKDVNPSTFPYLPPFIDHFEICNGDINSNIHLEYEPYWGGNEARICVEFKCNKCTSTNYNKLPNTLDDLNKFLDSFLLEK
jgi:hypothetical protein